MSHILEVAQAEAARALSDYNRRGDGYCVSGQEPVFARPRLLPPVTMEQQRDAWIERSMRQGRRVSQLEAEVERLESIIRQWEAGEL
jgi:hypothetical protein